MTDKIKLIDDTHPILVAFDQSLHASYPFILVIGREPNTKLQIVNQVGTYDFRLSPRCGFWNTSYGMVARVMQMQTRDFKKLCIEKRGSPLVYADVMPIGIENSVMNKNEIRNHISTESVERHIQDFFTHDVIFKRVSIVFLSGIYNANPSVKLIENLLDSKSIQYQHVPFFFGTNTKKIQQSLSENSKMKIGEVVKQFQNSVNKYYSSEGN